MTLVELVERCRSVRYVASPWIELQAISGAVVDLHGEAFPCGFEQPMVVSSSSGERRVSALGLCLTPSEARAICTAIIGCADEIDGGA